MRTVASQRFAEARFALGLMSALLLFVPASPAAGADVSWPGTWMVAGWFDRSPSVFPLRLWRNTPPAVTQAPPAAEGPPKAPFSLVHVHVSAELLTREAQQSVDKELAVRDVILGVPVQGKARLLATTRLKLLEDHQKGVFDLILTGSAVSTTRADAGQAIIYSRTVTRFTARKQVVLDQNGLHALPAKCHAVAQSTITSVSSPLPRLRGRLAKRVAWRRAQSQNAEAERISARHSEQTIGRSFDTDIARELQQANVWLADRLKNGAVVGDKFQPRFRTSVDGLRVTGLTGNLKDLTDVQDKLKEFEVALGLLFENDHFVLTVGVPQTKGDVGGVLAESKKPAVPRAASLLKFAPKLK